MTLSLSPSLLFSTRCMCKSVRTTQYWVYNNIRNIYILSATPLELSATALTRKRRALRPFRFLTHEPANERMAALSSLQLKLVNLVSTYSAWFTLAPVSSTTARCTGGWVHVGTVQNLPGCIPRKSDHALYFPDGSRHCVRRSFKSALGQDWRSHRIEKSIEFVFIGHLWKKKEHSSIMMLKYTKCRSGIHRFYKKK